MATRFILGFCLGATALAVACGGPPLANEEELVNQPDGTAGGGGAAGSAGQSGAAGSNGGSAGAAPFTCAADEAPFYGAPVDATNGCLDTAALVLIGCGPYEGVFGERCLKRRSDGARYWSMLDGVPRFDGSLWERCTDPLGAPEPAPPVCVTRTCAVPAPGFCTPSAMVEIFSCGSPIGEWDESCCQRPKCETVADCALDEDCRMVTVLSRRCWPQGDASSCDCAGKLMVGEELRCIPTPSG